MSGLVSSGSRACAEQLLETYSSTNHLYTVRANANRQIQTENDKQQYVRDVIAQKKTHQGTFTFEIPAGHKRSARTAMISVRAAKVTLLLRDQRTERIRQSDTHAVYAFESSYVPDGEERIEWLLYTNHPIETNEDFDPLWLYAKMAYRRLFSCMENDGM